MATATATPSLTATATVTVTVRTLSGTMYSVEIPSLDECRARCAAGNIGYFGYIGYLYLTVEDLMFQDASRGEQCMLGLFVERRTDPEDATVFELQPCRTNDDTFEPVEGMVFHAVVSFDHIEVIVHRVLLARVSTGKLMRQMEDIHLVYHRIHFRHIVRGNRFPTLASYGFYWDPETDLFYPESAIKTLVIAEYRGEPELVIWSLHPDCTPFESLEACLVADASIEYPHILLTKEPIRQRILDLWQTQTIENVDGADDEDPTHFF